jgi:hypothetical protein
LPAEETLVINGNAVKIDVGPNFSASVRYEGTGYAFRTVLGSNHHITLHLSPGPSALVLGQREEFLYGNLVSVTCVPPVTWIPCALSTDLFPIACTGSIEILDGGVNIVGTHSLASQNDAVVVAGQSVPALHFRDHWSIQGTTQGTQDEDLWFRTTDGLLLRHITTTRDSTPISTGPATYSASLDYTLQSETPSPLPADTDGGL